ncbi:LOW QUALITY PROTEIN: coatomer subunit zeta-1 [Guaruba guarouba]
MSPEAAAAAALSMGSPLESTVFVTQCTPGSFRKGSFGEGGEGGGGVPVLRTHSAQRLVGSGSRWPNQRGGAGLGGVIGGRAANELRGRFRLHVGSGGKMEALLLEPSLYTVKAIIILDNDGERLFAKYYDGTYPSAKEQKSFEKNIFNKTHRSDKLRFLVKQLDSGEVNVEELKRNLEYAASLLEAVYIDETR